MMGLREQRELREFRERRTGRPTRELRVDPIACTGHGICAELLPEWIRLDDWGYPIIEKGPFPEELTEHVRRAVTACPALALRIATQG